jgi:SynChlorMet cassette protein ScmC
MPKKDKCFSLNLSDGQIWQISSTEEILPWLEKFASILELKPCFSNGHPKLTFVRKDSSRELSELAKKGWRAENHSTIGFISHPEWTDQDHKNARFWSHPDRSDIICELNLDENGKEECEFLAMWLALYPFYKKALNAGGFPFHAGLIKRNGRGFLLSASGGTGKSTSCRRLPHPFEALCDDETLIARAGQGKYFAHPFPTWSDFYCKRPYIRNYNVEQHLPLAAIFFLERAEKDSVVPIGHGEAAIYIFNAAKQSFIKNWKTIDADEQNILKSKLFDNACVLAKTIPSYKLRISLTGRFWEEIEKVIL